MLELFKYQEKEVRVVKDEKGEPWFVGKDVCEYFGDTNYKRSLSRLESYERGIHKVDTLGGPQDVTIISESGLYQLLFNFQPQKGNVPDEIIEDRLDKIKKFRKWVTSEVLPQIRKTGGYIPIEKGMTDLEIMARAVLISQRTIEEKDKLIDRMAPKELVYDNIVDSSSLHGFNEVAKLIGWGRNKLMEQLRLDDVLMWNNKPYQQHIDSKRFEVKVGESRGFTYTTTYITDKGLVWLEKTYGKEVK
jgi:anti-repressor protein